MKTVPRLALATALLGALLVPFAASAQSELDVSEAEAFMGNWVISMESDFGPFALDLEITDQDGKVTVSIGSPELGGMQSVTDVTREGESLVLNYEADAQGQYFPVTVTLEPDGENLSTWFEVGGGEFAAGGTTTRSEG